MPRKPPSSRRNASPRNRAGLRRRGQPSMKRRALARTQASLAAGLFTLRANESAFGVASSIVILESEGRKRSIKVGGVRHLFQLPAHRPRHRLVSHMANDAIARLFTAFAHPQRVSIMKAIYTGAASYADLREKVGLKAGPMYHHIKELRLAGVVSDGPRDLYRLTPRGEKALIVVCSMSSILE
jgi:DNA-binding transcriptional ArsR family regulator